MLAASALMVGDAHAAARLAGLLRLAVALAMVTALAPQPTCHAPQAG